MREKNTVSRGMRSLASELDYRDGRQEERFDVNGTAERLNEYKELIPVGQPLEGISKLGGLDRQLLQSTDFHTNGRTVLKKLSAEEVAERETINFQKLPCGLREVVSELTKKEENIGSLLSVIKAAQGHKDILDWITLNWREYVEVDESKSGLILLGCSEDVPDNDEDSDGPKAQFVERLGLPPKDQYSVVEVFRPNQFKEASERRRAHLKSRLEDLDKMYLVPQLRKYMDQIRPTYAEDMSLLREWNQDRRAEDRAHYLYSLRSRGLDFESIRGKLWATFDRLQEEKVTCVEMAEPVKANWMAGYTSKKKKEEHEAKDLVVVTTQTKKIDPPIWDIERSRALCELHHTKGQWNKVYSLIWKQMGNAILLLARRAYSEQEKNEVRMLLANYQDRISQKVVVEIADSLSTADEVSVCVI